MIGELLQLSRENEELRKEIDALKAELAQEREKSERLREYVSMIRNAYQSLPCDIDMKKAQALLAAKRDEGNG